MCPAEVKPDYNRIISYFLECLKAEASESITLQESSNKLLQVSEDLFETLTEFFFEDQTYLDIPFTPEWTEFNTLLLSKFKGEKLYLAPKYCFKRQRSQKGKEELVFAPLYFTEINLEARESQEIFKLSKNSLEPGFNFSFLSEEMTPEEKNLLHDEIQEIETWHEKVNFYEAQLDPKLEKWLRSNPLIFISGKLDTAQSSVLYELEIIQKNHKNEISETALRFLLDKTETNPPEDNIQEFIEVFAMNVTQAETVKYALNHPFTVITGPPGTGKSQVVLNLLANLALNGQTVLFASKNNQAVNTVIDKLESIQTNYCPFIRVGNKNEKTKGLERVLTSLDKDYIQPEKKTYLREINSAFKRLKSVQDEIKHGEEIHKNLSQIIQTLAKEKKKLPIELADTIESIENEIQALPVKLKIADQNKEKLLAQLERQKLLEIKKQELKNQLETDYKQVWAKLPDGIQQEMDPRELATPLSLFEKQQHFLSQSLNKIEQKQNSIEDRIHIHKQEISQTESGIEILSAQLNVAEVKFKQAKDKMLAFETELPKLESSYLSLENSLDSLDQLSTHLRGKSFSENLKAHLFKIEEKVRQLPLIDSDNYDPLCSNFDSYITHKKSALEMMGEKFNSESNLFDIQNTLKALPELNEKFDAFIQKKNNAWEKLKSLFSSDAELIVLNQTLKNISPQLDEKFKDYTQEKKEAWESLNTLLMAETELLEIQDKLKKLVIKNPDSYYAKLFTALQTTPIEIQTYLEKIAHEIDSGKQHLNEWLQTRKRLDDLYLQLKQLEKRPNPHEEIFLQLQKSKDYLFQEQLKKQQHLLALNETLTNLEQEREEILNKAYLYEKETFLHPWPECLQKEFQKQALNLRDLEILHKWLTFAKKLEKLFQEIQAKYLTFVQAEQDWQTIYEELEQTQENLKQWLKETTDMFQTWPPATHEVIGFDGELDRIEEFEQVMNLSEGLFSKLQGIFEIQTQISQVSKQLQKMDNPLAYENRMEQYQKEVVEKSRDYFNQMVYERIHEESPKLKRLVEDFFSNWKDAILKKIFEQIKQNFPIFITTNLSARYNIPNLPGLFDYVIIDEASQNDIASVLPLLFRAKNLVIIGDKKQLKHIASLPLRTAQKLANEYLLPEEEQYFEYTRNSAFDLAERRYLDATYETQPFLLKNHYRCHQEIINFSNLMFYDSQLFNKSYIQKDISPIKPGIHWIAIKGNFSNKQNYPEALHIVKYIKELHNLGLQNKISLGIITPFKNQETLLRELLLKYKINFGKKDDWVLASTVHKFQGDEKDVIIYSPVFSEGIQVNTMRWLDSAHELLNVAVTRARNALLIMGDERFCESTESSKALHQKLLDYCKRTEAKRKEPHFESPTEGIFYRLLKNNHFDFEYQYEVNNIPRYRLDFVLKRSSNYLVIELDGKQHQNQKSYDFSRDAWLKKHGFEVLRYPNQYVQTHSQEIIEQLKKTCLTTSE